MSETAYRCSECQRSCELDGRRMSDAPLSTSQWSAIEVDMTVVDMFCNECKPAVQCFTTDEIIATRKEVGRELGVRKSVYQKWIESGRMTRDDANRQYQDMARAYAILKYVETHGISIPKPEEKPT